jgi:iron complex outermembrane receptor protein
VRLDGFEGEFNVLPVDNLMVSLSANYLYSAYQEIDPRFSLIDPLTNQLVDMTGKPLPNAPRFTGNLLVRYTIPMPSLGGALTLQGDLGWRTSAYLYPVDSPSEEQAGYTTTNLRVSFMRDNGWEFALWGKNLANNAYYDFLVRQAPIGYPTGVLSPPRTFGVEISGHL